MPKSKPLAQSAKITFKNLILTIKDVHSVQDIAIQLEEIPVIIKLLEKTHNNSTKKENLGRM